MRDEETVSGIVLYATLLNEYDKRLVVLTREKGKITMFANGARRPNSTLRAASQSFVMGQFTIRYGREAYTLLKVEVDNYFSELAQDMEKMCYASYFGELMSYYTREGDFCTDNLNLLYVTLKTLIDTDIPPVLIKSVFQLKLMDIEGQGIHAYSCVKCGKSEELIMFDAGKGGLLCKACSREKDSVRVTGTLVYTLKYILSSPIGSLYSFKLSDEALEELAAVSDSFLRRYVDKSFKSLEILEAL